MTSKCIILILVLLVNLSRKCPQLQSLSCAMCGHNEEIVNHLFFTCKIVKSVWNLCYNWVGGVTVMHSELIQHLSQFTILRLNIAINKVWSSIGSYNWGNLETEKLYYLQEC